MAAFEIASQPVIADEAEGTCSRSNYGNGGCVESD